MDDKEDSMSTHTPGPWYEMTRGRNEYQSAICQEATGNTVALTYTSNDADARLIAAAPALLEALKDLLMYVDQSSLEGGYHTRNARQAIAQAEGTAK
jgi:hypothetical protein